MFSQNKILKEKERIVSKCSNCNGIGCGICAGYCAYVDQMVEACIPVDYWHRKIEDFYGDENFKNYVMEYIKNLDQEFLNGLTLCFVGHRGTGKTFAACSILKKALLKKYSVFYTTMVDSVTTLLSGSSYSYRELVKTVDFMILDEVDQRFFPSAGSQELYGSQFEYILRTRSQNKLPTILCTNSENTSEIFSGQFKESFDSLSSQFVNIIRAGGKDARKGNEKL
jgi:DNA replication protein DnaC